MLGRPNSEMRRAPPTRRPPPAEENAWARASRTDGAPHMRRLRACNVAMGAVHLGLLVATVASAADLRLQAPLYRLEYHFNFTMDQRTAVADLERRVRATNLTMAEHLGVRASEAGGLPIGVLTVAFFGVTAACHFGAASAWRRPYEAFLLEQRNPLRWAEYAVTAPLMWLILAQAFGLMDPVGLALSATAISVTMWSGYQTEWVARPNPTRDEWMLPLRERLSFMIPGSLLFTAAVVTLLVTLLTNIRATLPSFIVPVVLVQFALFDSFAGVLLWQQCMPPSRWIYGEYAYQALSLISKAVLGIVLIMNVLIYSDYLCVFDDADC